MPCLLCLPLSLQRQEARFYEARTQQAALQGHWYKYLVCIDKRCKRDVDTCRRFVRTRRRDEWKAAVKARLAGGKQNVRQAVDCSCYS